MSGVGSAPLDNRRPDIDGARTIGQLVADASRDVSTLVRSEIELAKAEVTGGLKVAGKGAGMLGAAGFASDYGKYPFAPHLTLVRRMPPPPDSLPEISAQEWPCRDVVLIGSDLSGPAPAYTIVDRFPLAQPPF